jgi:hypothetical protein
MMSPLTLDFHPNTVNEFLERALQQESLQAILGLQFNDSYRLFNMGNTSIKGLTWLAFPELIPR